MKKVILLVAVVALMLALTAFVGAAKHSTTNIVKVDNVATMTYGMDGGTYSILGFAERHKAMRASPVDKKAMKLRPIQKLAK
jgi:hypothetical protein